MGLFFGVFGEALLCLEVLRTLSSSSSSSVSPRTANPSHDIYIIPSPGHSSAKHKIHCQPPENPHPLANAITCRDLLPTPREQ